MRTTTKSCRPKRKKFRVLCAVTRSEWYEVFAYNAQAARVLAFSTGNLVEEGETTDVTECEVVEVQS